MYKRTLAPIKTLIYGMRRYDIDRVIALYDPSEQGGKKAEGYMSQKAKIYLADVHDHMEYVLTSIEMFAGISENLINYSFNVSSVFPSLKSPCLVLTAVVVQMSSHEMNEVMRTLTIATVLFVPLTLLTGYFVRPFLLFPPVSAISLAVCAGYELRLYVVRPRTIRYPLLGNRTPHDGRYHRHILLERLWSNGPPPQEEDAAQEDRQGER